MANSIANSPITLEADPNGWRSIPEVPVAVQDAFGTKADVILHRGRWRGLVRQGEQHVFAWLDGRKLLPSSVATTVTFGQTLESDERGRALVIGGAGESLYAVDPSGTANCLGVLAEGAKCKSACWLARGGVALVIGSDVCVYTPGPDGRLLPRLRFTSVHPWISALRSLPSEDPELFVLASMDDNCGAIYAITSAGQVHVLANFDGLVLADVRVFLDETGKRMMLPDGAGVSLDGGPATVGGIEPALALLAELPLAELTQDPAPDLDPGSDAAAPSGEAGKLDVGPTVAPDAAVAPDLARLGRMTAALIKMLRAAPKRSTPDAAILKLIRSDMPADLRAYIHAWAVHAPNNPSVYEFWMAPPKLETREFVREHAGDSVSLGIFASGEPIVGRLGGGSGSSEIVMIDEEGRPYRYRGFEGFLLDLQMRAEDSTFELDAWLD